MFCSPQHLQQSIPIVPEEACKIPALYLIAVLKTSMLLKGPVLQNKNMSQSSVFDDREALDELGMVHNIHYQFPSPCT